MIKKFLGSFLFVAFISLSNINATTFNIESVEDWDDYVSVARSSSNARVNINADIDFKNKTYSYFDTAKGTIIEGNNHTLTNIKINHLLIKENNAKIQNLTFKNINASGTDRVGLIAYNKSIINNVTIDSVTFKGRDRVGFIVDNQATVTNTIVRNYKMYGRKFVAPIAKNTGFVNRVKVNNGYVVGDSFVSGLVGLNEGRSNKGIYITNSSADTITLKSKLAHAKKKYRNTQYIGAKKDLPGDFFGGLVGKNDVASVSNSNVNKISIYADDALGGAIGFNGFTKYNKKTKTAVIKSVHAKDITIYGGAKIGGLLGSNNNNNKIVLKQITTKAKGKALRARVLSSSVKGNLKVVGCINVGGAAGFNNNAYMEKTVVNVNNSPINVSASKEEVAGFVGEMEFGYVTHSKTNATVKTTGTEAAGFVADSEGTVVSSHSSSRVYGKDNIAGFISSNMGYVGYSSFTGKVYASKGKGKKAKKVGNFSSYKAKAKKYRGFKLKPRYVKCKAKGARYVKNKKVKNVFFGIFKGN